MWHAETYHLHVALKSISVSKDLLDWDKVQTSIQTYISYARHLRYPHDRIWLFPLAHCHCEWRSLTVSFHFQAPLQPKRHGLFEVVKKIAYKPVYSKVSNRNTRQNPIYSDDRAVKITAQVVIWLTVSKARAERASLVNSKDTRLTESTMPRE